MPFIEVLGFDRDRKQRERAAAVMTTSLSRVWEIRPDIVSTYFVQLCENGYAHAGEMEEVIENRRIFVKVHAFPRSLELRRAAARDLTASLAEACGADPALVAIYFFDREPTHVAHGGELSNG